jgi:20S proteasome subunit alpha 5
MTLQEAETLALSILKQVMEEKINSTNVEVAAISTEAAGTELAGKFRRYSKEDIETIIQRLP